MQNAVKKWRKKEKNGIRKSIKMLQNKRKSVDDFVKIWYFKYIQKKKKEKRRVLKYVK